MKKIRNILFIFQFVVVFLLNTNCVFATYTHDYNNYHTQNTINTLFNYAYNENLKGNYNSALQNYIYLYKNYKLDAETNAAVARNIGVSYYNLNDKRNSLIWYKKSFSHKKNLEVANIIISICNELKKHNEIIPYLEFIYINQKTTNEKNAEMAYFIAHLYKNDNNIDKAINYFNRCIEHVNKIPQSKQNTEMREYKKNSISEIEKMVDLIAIKDEQLLSNKQVPGKTNKKNKAKKEHQFLFILCIVLVYIIPALINKAKSKKIESGQETIWEDPNKLIIVKKISEFRQYKEEEIINNFKIIYGTEKINVQTPPLTLESFYLDDSRYKELLKFYNDLQKEEEKEKPAYWPVFLILCIIGVLISTGNQWIIPVVLLYGFSFIFDWLIYEIREKPSLECSKYELNVFLLCKGVIEKYEIELNKAKKIEEEKIRKKRQKEEYELKQKEEYWAQYWDEVAQDGFLFEKEIKNLYRKLDYKVELTKSTGDGGVDLILYKDKEKIIVQCKAHSHQVGPEPVRALWGVKDDFEADSVIFIAYSGVTSGAKNFAKGKNYKILDKNDIVKLSIKANKIENINIKE